MPDVRDASSFNHCSVTLKNGHGYHYVDQDGGKQSRKRPVCVLLHGFPDLWYGWRYPLVALVNAGFRVICPSQLGYYPSSQPENLDEYGYKNLSNDLEELLQNALANEAEQQILLFGHDWGGLLAWRFAAYHTKRVKAIAVVSTPYLPPAYDPSVYSPAQKGLPFIPDEVLVEKMLPNFGYQLWWKTDEAADIIGKNLEAFLVPQFSQLPKKKADQSHQDDREPITYRGRWRQRMLELDEARRSGKRTFKAPSVEEDPECAYYVDSFRKGGIARPLNYYKIRKVNHDQEVAAGIPKSFPTGIPTFFLTGDNDTALPLSMSDPSPKYFSKGQYKREVIEGADHWLLQDARFRDEVSARLVHWADRHSSSRQAKL